MRLSTRIALAVGVLVPLLVLASGWIMVRLVAGDVHRQADAHLRQRAADVQPEAKDLLRAMANDRPAGVEEARSRRLFTAALDVGIRVTGPGGTVSGGPQPAASVPLPSVEGAAAPVTVRAGRQSWRVLAVPVRGTRTAAPGTLWLFAGDTAGQAQISQVRRRVLGVAVLTAPVAGAVAWFAAVRLARPLLLLRRRAAGLDPRVSAARLDHAASGVPEIDDLARTLQTVLARYDEQAARTGEALASARSFSAAASHELRTPLMSMRINLDVLDGDPAPGPAERAEIVADLRAEHERLLGLLVMLRTLAQGDLVEADAFAPVDLVELVDAAVRDLRRDHPRLPVTSDAAGPCPVVAWPPGLRSAVDNLLTNAVVHGSGTVEVAVRPVGAAGAVRISVADHGPGVPPDARDAVFHRFHRRPDSDGSGLGLALVAQQAALHGGAVTVTARPDGRPGACFVLELPRATAPPTLPRHRDWLTGSSTGG
ncbi:HAMP domain-containing sensor histidine kinase [Streptomyces sp. V4-01]|uniref:histidine kinase n=1 Tax=Actinacidiphila polyblastidii TaxID=3110430 RepID=A0ABU7PAQ9_9ACTN|nr:HAMP domain-containing sensor histidine kinase [Streptomyces sp. V4-01]